MNIRIPVSWLREYLKTDVTAKTIASYLTVSGPSVERIEKHGEDLIFDVEITTNRPDAFSVFGLAREAHAILSASGQKSQLIQPKGINQNLQPDTKNQLPLEVIIRDPNLCNRFTAQILDNVEIKPSPAHIRNRLEASGIRAINNIVDISNYIMLELGQPMHTFDYDKIKGAKMILRQAQDGEKIRTLDGQTRKIPKGTIIIEDAERLIDLCGIMGGENSQISSRTKRVVMFVQSYNPLRIRKTTQRMAFRTEAASRFEKEIDLEGIIPALARSIYLTKQTTKAKIASELIDIFPNPPKPKPIILSRDKLDKYLGIKIPQEKVGNILSLLGFNVSSNTQTISASPPSYRFSDMEIEEDLIEEIARVYGYQNLPSELPTGKITQSEESILTSVIELKKALKFLGLTEIISYSIISSDFLSLTGIHQSEAVELTNPLTEEWQFMRPTLLVPLAQIIGQNQHLPVHRSFSGNRKSILKLFEIAKTYEWTKGAKLPKQDLKLAIVLWPAQFSEIEGYLENVFEILLRDCKLQKLTLNNPIFEKTQSAQIKISDKSIGFIGMLNQSILDYFQIEDSIAACEINLTTCYQLPTTHYTYHPIPKYPPVIEDISAILDEKVAFGNIVAEIKKAGEPLVKNIEVIDIYTDLKLGKNKKSITLRLTYQKTNETPTQEEVTRFRNIIIRELERTLKAQIRK